MNQLTSYSQTRACDVGVERCLNTKQQGAGQATKVILSDTRRDDHDNCVILLVTHKRSIKMDLRLSFWGRKTTLCCFKKKKKISCGDEVKMKMSNLCLMSPVCLAAVSPGVSITVAEEARWAGHLQRGAQHLEGLQPQEQLSVPLQWCPDCHQEEEVCCHELWSATQYIENYLRTGFYKNILSS